MARAEKVVAHHEAGHALAAHTLKQPIASIEVTESGGAFRHYDEPQAPEPKPDADAALRNFIGPDDLNAMWPMMVILLAGRAAQRRIAGYALQRQGDGRLWRSVPGRRWYSDQRGNTPASQEVVLIHRKATLGEVRAHR